MHLKGKIHRLDIAFLEGNLDGGMHQSLFDHFLYINTQTFVLAAPQLSGAPSLAQNVSL